MTVPKKKRLRYLLRAREIARQNNIALDDDDWPAIWAMIDQHGDYPYLYAIVDRLHGLVKFGKSVNPGARLKQMKTGNGSDLELWAFCPQTATLTERSVHADLKADRVSGEWFQLSDKARAYINQMRHNAGVKVL